MKKSYIAFSVLLLCVFCSGLLYSCFRPPANTPCMPIDYPDGKKIEAKQRKIYTFETSDPYDDVYKFFRMNLKLDPQTNNSYELATWKEYSIRDIGILFECVSKLNSYESELGCIFVNKKEGNVVVYAMWSYNEGPGIPCYFLPEIEPDDY